jgi:CubicO group peptidase (beta-lactamase class C family)
MKTKRILLFLFLIFVALYWSPYQYFYKALWYNYANIDDYKIFENRTLSASDVPLNWKASPKRFQPSKRLINHLDTLETTVFQMYHNDTIIYNKTFPLKKDTISNSFSMAKSIVAAAIGRALKLKYIPSLDQSLGSIIPEWQQLPIAKITIKHLLTMSSGIKWDESYNLPWSQTTQLYYGDDITAMISYLKLEHPPGTFFQYKSIDTQLLVYILQRLTHQQMSTFVEKELWKPLGATHSALWSLDHKNGIEKGYCCVHAFASDFARLGLLYMYEGNWKGKQLIDTTYIQQCITPNGIQDDFQKPCHYYGFQWWLIPNYKGYKIFYMRGILGQYVICIPELKLMAVRLGEKRGVKNKNDLHYPETFLIVDELIEYAHASGL